MRPRPSDDPVMKTRATFHLPVVYAIRVTMPDDLLTLRTPSVPGHKA
jgi:hypothetical protein